MSTTQLAEIAPIHALVAYIPGPLGDFVDRFRASFPGEPGGRAHLTLLPPRPIYASAHMAREFISGTLADFPEFVVELGPVRRFPVTNSIYLDVSRGAGQATELHAKLNRGPLHFAEPFEYRPHVTLLIPSVEADAEEIEKAAAAEWDRFREPKHFLVKTLEYLHQAPNGRWRRIESTRLSPSR